MSNRMHEMVKLLRECGEDMKCGCGCSGDDEPEDSKDKKKSKSKDKETVESVSARVLTALSEARRKIGIKAFRRMKMMQRPRPGRGEKVRHTSKLPVAVRSGAGRNRHR